MSTPGGRIARNTLALFSSEVVGRVLSFLATILLTRSFAIDLVGQYALAVTLVGLAASFGDLGLNALSIREVAADRSQAPRYLRAAMVWRFASSLFFLGGLAVWGSLAGYEPLQRLAVIAMGTRLVFDALAGGYVYLLQAHERMAVQGWTVAMGSLARFLGLGVVVLLGGSIVWACAVWSIVSAATLAFLAAVGMKSGWKPRWKDFDFSDAAGILRAALPLAVMGTLQMLYYRVDVVMLKSLSGNAPVALYYGAYRILEAALVLANMAALAALPALSARRSDPDAFGSLAEKLLRVLVLGGFLVSSVGVAVAPAVMPLLFGPSYAAGGPVMAILFLSAAPFFLNALTVDLWTIRDPKRLAVWYLSLLAANVALNWFWIPAWGPSGAAAATLACEVGGVLAALPWVLREMPSGVLGRLVRWLGGSLLGASAVYAGSRFWGGLQWLLLGPLCFAAILLITRTVTPKDGREALESLRKG